MGAIKGSEMNLQTVEGFGDSAEALIDLLIVCNPKRHAAKKWRRVEGFELILPASSSFTKCFHWFVLELLLEAIDLGHKGLQALDGALVFGADDFLDDPVEHSGGSEGQGKAG